MGSEKSRLQPFREKPPGLWPLPPFRDAGVVFFLGSGVNSWGVGHNQRVGVYFSGHLELHPTFIVFVGYHYPGFLNGIDKWGQCRPLKKLGWTNPQKRWTWDETTSGWWFGTFHIFPYGNFIIPTDELVYVLPRGGCLNHQPDICWYKNDISDTWWLAYDEVLLKSTSFQAWEKARC